MDQYKKELFFDQLFEMVGTARHNTVLGVARVTNPNLGRILKRHYNKFKSQVTWDEFLGSAMAVTWMQIERFDADWDAILEGDEREQNKLFSAISQSIYFGAMEAANPNSKFFADGIVEIDFLSLNEIERSEDDSALELQDTEELESYFTRRDYEKTPFMKWVDANYETILSDYQARFFERYRTCLDNSQEEVEGKTGVKHKDISRKVKLIKKKLETAWEKERGFEHTYLYQELMSEKEYLESYLDQDFDTQDYIREAAADIFANNKLGNLLIDHLNHQELIGVNTGSDDKKLAYRITQVILDRLARIDSFLEQEERSYGQSKGPLAVTSQHFNYRNETSDCLVYNRDGELIRTIPAQAPKKHKVRLMDGFGHTIQKNELGADRI